MLKTIRQFFQFFEPPVFPDDEDKTRTARVLNALLLNMLAVYLLTIIATIFVFPQKIGASIFILILFCMLLASHTLARRGRVRLASILWVVGMWIFIALVLLLAGRITTVIPALFVAHTIIAGILLGRRSAIVIAVLSSIIGLGLTIFEITGYPLTHYFPLLPMSNWVVFVFAILLTITPLYVTLQGLDQSLAFARESELRFRLLAENSSDMISRHDSQGVYIYVSPASRALLGYEPEELIGHSAFEFIHPDDIPAVDQSRSSIIDQPVVSTTIFRIRCKDGKYIWLESTSRTIIETGDIVEIHAASRDVTERKKTEEALQESRLFLSNIIEYSEALIFVKDRAGYYGLINRKWEKVTGLKREDVIGHTDEELFPDPIGRQFRANDIEAMESGKAIEREEILDDAQGRRYFLSVKFPLYDESGNVKGLCGMTTEITDRKRTEAALIESENLYRKMIENSPLGMHFYKLNGDNQLIFVGANPTADKLLGVDNSKFIGKTIEEAFPPLTQTEVPERYRDAATRGVPWSIEQITYEDKQILGAFEVSAFQTTPKNMVAVFADITKRKRAEEALRESTAKLETMIQVSPLAIILVDLNENIQLWNSSAERIFGWTAQEIIGCPNPIVPASKQNEYIDWSDQITQGKVLNDQEAVRQRKDGSLIDVSISSSHMYDEVGNVTGRMAIIADISARKQVEEALRESEEHLRSLYDNAMIGMYRTTPDGRILLTNSAGVRMLGYDSFEEIATHNLEKDGSGPKYDRSQFRERMKRDGIITGLESAWKRKDGSTIYIRESATAIKDSEGKILYYDGTFEDITERKKAEEALRESEERFASLSESTFEGIGFSDKGIVIECNEQLTRMLGCERADIIGEKISKFVAPESLEDVIVHIKSGSEKPYEHLSLRKDGSKFPVEIRAKSLPYKGQTVRVTTVRDITERKQAEEHIQNQLERLNALRNIDDAIKSSFDLHTTLKIFLGEVTAQLKVDATSVLLFNKNTLTLDRTANRGFQSTVSQYTKLGSRQSYAEQVILDRKTIHIPDLTKTENKLAVTNPPAGENFITYIGSPLIAKGQVVGVLEIYQRSPLAPAREWFNFLNMLVGQAAIAIDNAQLFENLQHSNFDLTFAYDATIEGWSRAMDLRDKETEGHTQRVTSLTVKLARQMGIPDTEIIHIRRGALLHDIGKMGIPDNILLKPGKLTPEEWDIMRQHTIYAYDMLLPIHYLKPALDIPQYHHERWDGTGYPHKLKGEDIPLPARIFAVVDVWDAVTSDRPYRSGWTKEKTIEHIKSESGKHFDPKVVEMFLPLISHKGL